ncbi:MAG: DsrE family protein [Gammaproteobacteria bacterium]|nr:DsrE family protein [Gammaproteobacteria bacterium]
MKITIIIYTNDPETAWNAFRLGNASLAYDNTVRIFLLGKGVEVMTVKSIKYNVVEQAGIFIEHGGVIMGCELCCDTREDEMPYLKEEISCDLGSMQDLYALISDADKVLTF